MQPLPCKSANNIWKRAKSLAEFADYLDDADLAKLDGVCAIFLNTLYYHAIAWRVCLLGRSLAGSRVMDLRTPSLQAAAASESELPPGGRAIDLYAPSLPGAVSAALELPQDLPTVGRAIDLYAPSLQSLGSPKLAPKRGLRSGGCRSDLYAPSLPASGSLDSEPPRQPPTDCQVVDLYTPASQTSAPSEMGMSRIFGIGLRHLLGPGSCRPWSDRPAVGENEPPLHLCGRHRQLDALVRHGFRPTARNRRGSCRKCRCRPIALSRPTRFRSKRSNWCRGRPTALRPTTCCRLACAERYPISPSTVTTLWKARGP